jgi:hypothetical protein
VGQCLGELHVVNDMYVVNLPFLKILLTSWLVSWLVVQMEVEGNGDGIFSSNEELMIIGCKIA